MDIATPENVKELLTLDDDKIAELRKEQEKALKKFRSRARLSPTERQIGRGVELEHHYRQTGKKDGIAEALIMQGRFDDAVKIAESDKLKSVINEKINACGCGDCTCPSHRTEGGLRLPNQYIESYEIVDGKQVPAVRCILCKKLSIGLNLEHLEQQKAERAKSVEQGRDITRSEQFFR